MTLLERLHICRDLARAVGRHPDCPESERAAAVRRVYKYTDAIASLELGPAIYPKRGRR